MRARQLTRAVIALAAAAACASACNPSVPGSVAGEPCNANGVCASGLICDTNNLCQDENGPAPTGSWLSMRLPDNPTLHGVWGHSASDVVAVGSSGKIFTYNGNATNDFAFAAQGVTTKTLYGVWGTGNQYWVVGSSVVLHFDGSTWSESTVWDTGKAQELTGYTLYAIHGDASSSTIYAVGQRSSGSDGLVVKWSNGSRRFESVDAANLSFAGRGVWVLGAQAWIVGSAQHVKHLGSSWEEQNLPENAQLKSVWSNGNRLAAVGPASKVFQFGGSSGWSVQDKVRDSYTANGLWGDDNQLIIVGAGAGYQEEFSSIETCTSVCRGNIIDEKARGATLNAIWGTGNTLFAVGESGTIVRQAQ
ncbi:MAG: hypothetical protein KC503_37240 [Myxococcales bacterium]|nr:hypothetical protein [Myxococcales bacterium]